jgi:hypothetical protein
VSESEQVQLTVIKPLSLTAKGEVCDFSMKNAQMALTKVEIEVNFELLEFMLMVLQRYIVIYGRNPWLSSFMKEFLEHQQFMTNVTERLHISEFNTQIDDLSLVYLHDSGTPFLKMIVKIPNRHFSMT